jgi:hypothetical protein
MLLGLECHMCSCANTQQLQHPGASVSAIHVYASQVAAVSIHIAVA